jgi:type I restriction enzyme S subunit
VSDLPLGWAVSVVAEIAEVNPSKISPSCGPETEMHFVPKAAVTEEFGGIDISAKRPLREVQKGYTQFRENDVIVAKITPCMENGKIAVLPPLESEVAYGSTEFHVLRGHEGIRPKWLANFVSQKSFRKLAQRNMSGSAGQLRVPAKWIEGQAVPVAPQKEQERITRKIDELFSDLDASVAALERARANLKRYRASVLKAAVEGRLTAEWRKSHLPAETASQLLERILAERRKKWEQAQLAKFAAAGKAPPKNWKDKYPEPAKPDIANLPELPEGWCWATIDQTSEVQGGIQKQPKRTPRQNAYPYLRVANVYRNRLELAEIEYFELFGDELSRVRLEHGDLLIVEGNGSKSEIGRSAIWRGEIENCVHQNHIIRARFLAGAPEFLNAYWNSPSGNAKVMEKAASTSGLYTLSVQKVSELPLPLPPLDEQRKIIEELDSRLSVISQSESDVVAARARSAGLRQSILKRAFEGRLVPQDPKDEPASLLLERIRAARADAPKAATRRGRKSKVIV